MISIFPRHRKNRVAAMAAVTATAVLAVSGFAGAANASTTSSSTIRQVTCRSSTFNVYHGIDRGRRTVETCYEGTGTKVIRLSDVRVVTVGENTGVYTEILHGTLALRQKFNPKPKHNRFTYPANETEIVSVTITHT